MTAGSAGHFQSESGAIRQADCSNVALNASFSGPGYRWYSLSDLVEVDTEGTGDSKLFWIRDCEAFMLELVR
jgi:hypothetical protein